MKKLVSCLLFLCILTPAFTQTQRKLSLYLSGQYNETVYDRTLINNPWSLGLGLQVYLNNSAKFKPVLDVTADAYLMSVEVQFVDENGKPIDGIEGMINLFGGVSYHPTKIVYLSFVGGLSVINGKTLLGIKPSLGFYFSRTQRVTGKVGYINVFNRLKPANDDYGAITITLGVKLF